MKIAFTSNRSITKGRAFRRQAGYRVNQNQPQTIKANDAVGWEQWTVDRCILLGFLELCQLRVVRVR